MTTEERIRYVERAIICKKYKSSSSISNERIGIADTGSCRDDTKDIEANTNGDGQCHEASTVVEKTTTIERQFDPSPEVPKHHQSDRSFSTVSPQCAICLEPFCDGDMIFEPSSIDVDCMHEFHQHCIYQWCMLQTTCPCCRRELLFINNRPTTNEGVVVSQSIPINSSSTSP